MTIKRLALISADQVFDDHYFRFGSNGDEPWAIELTDTYKERGAVWAMVSVRRCVNGEPIDPPVVGPSRANIVRESRGGGLTDIVERMTDAYPQFAWEDMFQEAKLQTLRGLDTQLAPVSLGLKVGDNTGPPFLSRPYLAGNGMTILYGDGGTGKSALALTMALELTSGKRIISDYVPLPRNVLYIDYEDTHDTHVDRVTAIANAHRIDRDDIERIHRVSLVDIIASHTKELVKFTTDHEIGFVVIDSLGMACGGDITASEPVIRMGQSIRAMNVPVLGIHHNNKAGLPYGSVYIRNMARLMWQASPRQSKLGDAWDYIYLENQKANNVRRQPIQYLKVRFDNHEGQLTSVRYEPTDVHGFPEADQAPGGGSITQSDQILMMLQLNPETRYTASDLAEDLGASVNHVRNELNKLAKTRQIEKDTSVSPHRYWSKGIKGIEELPDPW